MEYDEFKYLGKTMRHYKEANVWAVAGHNRPFKTERGAERAIEKMQSSAFSGIESYISAKSHLLRSN